MRKRHVFVLAALLALATTQGISVLADTPTAAPAKTAAKTENGNPIIGTANLKAKLNNHEQLTLVEALESKYFDQWHLPGAIMMTDANKYAAKLLPDKKAEIVVYCMNTH